ncbi:hypothetical protein BJN45_00900 [Azonexus hydrophilus]|uniref:Uncharacterized protein n=1 Tax=Azonexus hydrophilus TaxID=418702 RepID=A0A1R1IC12_9RHOO|nr:hypothetical protein [Azonexus hydrophilus]OMG56224.1 hypothetical protein BJN45_00900 [Azonexus hydrophilus]
MSLISALADLLKPVPPPDPAVAAALDRVIGMVDPLVRAAPRLERHLLGAVEHALGYCQGLVAALPGPIEINRRSFANDLLVHALFASPADIEDMLGRSQAVRDFLDRPECWASDCFCAMLAARRQQKRQFGMAQQGNIIRADVPQEIVYFSDQTLIEPCCDLDTTRDRLQAKALESLLQAFNAHVDNLRRERESLRADLSVEHAWQHHNVSDEEKHTRHLVELDVQLRQNGEALMPENLIEVLADFLRHPETALSLTPVSICIDRMGIVHDAGQPDEDAQTISFPELSSRDRRQHLATLVRISREEALAAVNRSRDRQKRYILI